MPNWEARNAAIAKDLMGDEFACVHPWHAKDHGGCREFVEGKCPLLHKNTDMDCSHYKPPAYHKDPIAFDRLVKELIKHCDFKLLFGDHGTHAQLCEKPGVHSDACFEEGVADDYKAALVFAITEEGKFCPKRGGECHSETALMFSCSCGHEFTTDEAIPARVRPELRNAQEL